MRAVHTSTGAHARATDPRTSRAAEACSGTFTEGHCARILSALQECPATAHELQEPTGLTVVQIGRRLPELLNAGRARVVLVDGGALVRGGARVWEAL